MCPKSKVSELWHPSPSTAQPWFDQLLKFIQSVTSSVLIFQAKSEEEVNSQKAWLDAEKVWVVHKAGFSGGRVQKTKTIREQDETPMCKVKLDHGGEIITIEEDSVEKVSRWVITCTLLNS